MEIARNFALKLRTFSFSTFLFYYYFTFKLGRLFATMYTFFFKSKINK